MKLTLKRLPIALRWFKHPSPIPRSYRLLQPEAADALLLLINKEGMISITDLFRTAELSLLARSEKTGVQPPGYSLHNYGLAIDVDVDGTLKLRGWSYAKLVEVMKTYGFYPHRTDGSPGFEQWHFNFLGPTGAELTKTYPAFGAAAEMELHKRFGSAWVLNEMGVQESLKSLSLYSGEIDGLIGPRSKQGIAAFCRAWMLPVSPWNDHKFQRTLAFVSAKFEIIEGA